MHVAANCEDVARIVRMRIDDLKIFSDGSGEGNNIGTAAVILNGTQCLTSHYHLGSINEHIMFKGELTGILLALNLIWQHHNATQALIGLDNQSAIQALTSNRWQPGQYIIDVIHKELKKLKTHHSKLQVHIEWTPGHSGVEGNECADAEAKKASVIQTRNTAIDSSLEASIQYSHTQGKLEDEQLYRVDQTLGMLTTKTKAG
jgi:ribonuclease HI